jgi:hypothetical protein
MYTPAQQVYQPQVAGSSLHICLPSLSRQSARGGRHYSGILSFPTFSRCPRRTSIQEAAMIEHPDERLRQICYLYFQIERWPRIDCSQAGPLAIPG